MSAAADMLARASAVIPEGADVEAEVGALVDALVGEAARELVLDVVFDEVGR